MFVLEIIITILFLRALVRGFEYIDPRKKWMVCYGDTRVSELMHFNIAMNIAEGCNAPFIYAYSRILGTVVRKNKKYRVLSYEPQKKKKLREMAPTKVLTNVSKPVIINR